MNYVFGISNLVKELCIFRNELLHYLELKKWDMRVE